LLEKHEFTQHFSNYYQQLIMCYRLDFIDEKYSRRKFLEMFLFKQLQMKIQITLPVYSGKFAKIIPRKNNFKLGRQLVSGQIWTI